VDTAKLEFPKCLLNLNANKTSNPVARQSVRSRNTHIYCYELGPARFLLHLFYAFSYIVLVGIGNSDYRDRFLDLANDLRN